MFLRLKVYFIVLALFTIVGLDYQSQAASAGYAPSAYGITSYKDSVRERYDEFMANRNENRVQLTSFLPIHWDGWAIEEWSPRRAKALVTERNRLKALGEFADPTDEVLEAAFPKAWHTNPLGRKRGYTMIYTRGDELIEVTIKRNPKASNWVSLVPKQVNREGYENVPFGNIRGVKFVESIAWSKGVRVGAGSSSFRSISGHVDGQVLVAVSAIASSQSIKQLLGQINFRSIQSTVRAEMSGVEKRTSSLPQTRKLEWHERSKVKRVKVTPTPADRTKPDTFRQLMAQWF